MLLGDLGRDLVGMARLVQSQLSAGLTAFFQREVAQRLKLKYAAKIQFWPDESFDEADRIDRLLADPRVLRDLGEDDAE